MTKLKVQPDIAICVTASGCQPCIDCYRNPKNRYADKKSQVYSAFKFDGNVCPGFWAIPEYDEDSTDDMTVFVELEEDDEEK